MTKKCRSIKNKLLCGVLALATALTASSFESCSFLTTGGVEQVYAVATSEKKEKAATEDKLDDVNDQINDLNKEKASVSSKLSKKEQQLNDLMDEIKALKKQISSKQAEIDQCNEDLEAAEAKEEEEYDAMKVRIQYMYENSTADNMWTAILESDGITDMLNRIEYISGVYTKDRDLLTSYQDTVTQVEELQDKLTDEMDDLCDTQDELADKQDSLEAKIKELEDEKADCASALKAAKKLAAQYQDTITSLGKTIQKAEEAAAKAAAQRAAAAAAAKAKAKAAAEAAAKAKSSSKSSSSKSSSSKSSSSSSSSSKSSSSSSSSSKSSSSSSTSGDDDPAPTTGVSGSDVVAYALKFVGNPYVWGGNSLTNGTDCSGFVHLVYKHFGISTPRYSQAFLRCGKSVSYSNIQAGDVIVYAGHVAIADGHGKIVEAKGKKWGITHDRGYRPEKIKGIRRLI